MSLFMGLRVSARIWHDLGVYASRPASVPARIEVLENHPKVFYLAFIDEILYSKTLSFLPSAIRGSLGQPFKDAIASSFDQVL
jgi:hypothetical protein